MPCQRQGMSMTINKITVSRNVDLTPQIHTKMDTRERRFWLTLDPAADFPSLVARACHARLRPILGRETVTAVLSHASRRLASDPARSSRPRPCKEADVHHAPFPGFCSIRVLVAPGSGAIRTGARRRGFQKAARRRHSFCHCVPFCFRFRATLVVFDDDE